MIVVRPIVMSEAETFLRLLCEVFDLDLQRASGVFFREPFFDIHRKWALFEDGRMASVLTTVPLEFGWGRAIGIAGVATGDSDRGKGLAAALLRSVLDSAERAGEGPAYLFAKRTELYERVGFKVLDEVIRAPLEGCGLTEDPEELPTACVQEAYERWSGEDPLRLCRDERRWRFWSWNLRFAEPFGEGYIVNEGGVVRECIPGVGVWPVSSLDEWYGLRSLADRIGVPYRVAQHEMHVMGYGTSYVPQMFLTDQF